MITGGGRNAGTAQIETFCVWSGCERLPAGGRDFDITQSGGVGAPGGEIRLFVFCLSGLHHLLILTAPHRAGGDAALIRCESLSGPGFRPGSRSSPRSRPRSRPSSRPRSRSRPKSRPRSRTRSRPRDELTRFWRSEVKVPATSCGPHL